MLVQGNVHSALQSCRACRSQSMKNVLFNLSFISIFPHQPSWSWEKWSECTLLGSYLFIPRQPQPRVFRLLSNTAAKGMCMYVAMASSVLAMRWWTKVSKWHPAINTTHGKICTFARNMFCFSMKGQKDQYSYTRYGQDPITLEGEWGNNNHVH